MANRPNPAAAQALFDAAVEWVIENAATREDCRELLRKAGIETPPLTPPLAPPQMITFGEGKNAEVMA